MTALPPAHHAALTEMAAALRGQRIDQLFEAEADRADRFRCQSDSLVLDYSKHLLDDDAWAELLELASVAALPEAFTSLTQGEEVNASERRAALHTLLRGTARASQPALAEIVDATLARMRRLVEAIHSGQVRGFSDDTFTDVVNIGIGGSDLGPRLVCDALSRPEAPLRAHFVANIDPDDLDRQLASLDPARTLFVICSKSFRTEETLSNAKRARDWLGRAGAHGETLGRHLIAVTTAVAEAGEWDIPAERCFPLWDWVGGRYSLWSAIGLSIALSLGWHDFEALLQGAKAMDTHTATLPPGENLPMIMALLELWQTHYLGTDTHAVLPYAQRLALLPDFLQQLTMESNGKRVSPTGELLAHQTAPVLWGSAGTIGQHSYYQLLHQGTRTFTADIILPLRSGAGDVAARRALAAHALAQSRTLMVGRSPDAARELGASRGFDAETSRQFELPGNHSHSLMLMDDLSPASLGALLAAYEHKTFFLSVLLNLNPFDQWGVELGKEIAGQLHGLLESGEMDGETDPSTQSAALAWRDAN